MKGYRYRVEGMWPLSSGIHLDEEASRAFPERTNPHVHVARGTLFAQVGDVVLVSSTGEPIAVLTEAQFDELTAFLTVGYAENTTPDNQGGNE